MIFYFSGTGNSQAAAETIARVQQERLVSIIQAIEAEQYDYVLQKGEAVIFVFPVYAWAPPEIVMQFLSRLTFLGEDPDYLGVIVTYSKQIGNCFKVVHQAIEDKGWRLTSFYTLKMPHNYLIVGHTDSYERVYEILAATLPTLERINREIAQKEHVYEQAIEFFPRIRTLAGQRWMRIMSKRITPFYANDHCISCKVCEKICPTKCIEVTQKPSWKGECLHCLACLHYCPKSAIQYGKSKKKKKRYTHPDIRWYELNHSSTKNRPTKF